MANYTKKELSYVSSVKERVKDLIPGYRSAQKLGRKSGIAVRASDIPNQVGVNIPNQVGAKIRNREG